MFRRYGGDDARLVDRALQGDQDAFDVLVTGYSSVVYGIALAHLHNKTDAEDLSQDAFLQAYRSLGTLRVPNCFGPWLVTLTKNLCRNVLARRGREKRLSQNANVQSAPARMHPEREEIHAILLHELETLDETAREVLMLHYFTHKPIRDMAVLLGISKAAAAKRLQRARHVLGERLLTVAGDALMTEDKPQQRTRRIMAAIHAVPLMAKPIRMASGSAGTLTIAKVTGGLFAMKKLIAGGVVVLGILAGLYWSVQAHQAPDTDTSQESASRVQAAVKTPMDQPDPSLTTPTAVSQPAATAKTVETPVTTTLEPGEIADPTKYATLSGRTLTELGEPVAGAEVTLMCYGIPMNELLYEDIDQLKRAMKRNHLFQAVSDTEGRFLIKNIRFSGHAVIMAQARGSLSGSINVEIQEGMARQDLDIVMSDGMHTVHGRILTSTGSPVDDATIMPVLVSLSLSHTDARGVFSCVCSAGIPLNVYSARYGLATFNNLTNDENSYLELRMPGMASLSGRVTQSNGSPAVGIKVKLRGSVPFSGNTIFDQTYSVETDPNGHYEIHEINVGQKMDAFMTDTGGECRVRKSFGYLPPNQMTTWDAQFSKPIVVRGTVRGKQNHQPLALPGLFEVTVVKDGLEVGTAGGCPDSFPKGIYEITVPGGSGRYLIVPTYTPFSFSGFESYGREVNLVEGTEPTVDLELPEPIIVMVRVIDEDGNPIKGAKAITLGGSRRESGLTDDKGCLSLTCFAPNTMELIEGGKIEVFCAGYFTEKSRKFSGSPGQVLPEETIVLHPAGELTGRPILLDGEPMANGKLWVKFTYGNGTQQSLALATDSRGQFRLKIPATSLDLVGSLVPPNPLHSFSRTGLQCPAGQVLDLGDIQLENIDRSTMIE